MLNKAPTLPGTFFEPQPTFLSYSCLAAFRSASACNFMIALGQRRKSYRDGVCD